MLFLKTLYALKETYNMKYNENLFTSYDCYAVYTLYNILMRMLNFCYCFDLLPYLLLLIEGLCWSFQLWNFFKCWVMCHISFSVVFSVTWSYFLKLEWDTVTLFVCNIYSFHYSQYGDMLLSLPLIKFIYLQRVNVSVNYIFLFNFKFYNAIFISFWWYFLNDF